MLSSLTPLLTSNDQNVPFSSHPSTLQSDLVKLVRAQVCVLSAHVCAMTVVAPFRGTMGASRTYCSLNGSVKSHRHQFTSTDVCMQVVSASLRLSWQKSSGYQTVLADFLPDQNSAENEELSVIHSDCPGREAQASRLSWQTSFQTRNQQKTKRSAYLDLCRQLLLADQDLAACQRGDLRQRHGTDGRHCRAVEHRAQRLAHIHACSIFAMFIVRIPIFYLQEIAADVL